VHTYQLAGVAHWCTLAKTTLFASRKIEVRPLSAESATGDFQPIN